MTIGDLIKSRGNGIHFHRMLQLTTPHSAYPGKTPAPRVAIHRHLEKLEGQTRSTLDSLVMDLRSEPFFNELTPEEAYIFRQRLLCSFDFLARLNDSLPIPSWLETSSAKLEMEDQWLLIGVWKEFGQCWIQNLAWRISRGVTQE